MKKNGFYILAGGFAVLAISGYLLEPKIKTYLISKTNQQHLDSLNPKYKNNFTKFVNHLIALGYKVQINSSYRTFAQQAKEKKADSRNASPGFSPHNYGLGLDLQVSKNGKTLGKNTPITTWINSGIPNLAKSYGLAWGGNLPGYKDAVHWYIPLDTSKLYAMALQQFKTKNPALIQGNRLKIV